MVIAAHGSTPKASSSATLAPWEKPTSSVSLGGNALARLLRAGCGCARRRRPPRSPRRLTGYCGRIDPVALAAAPAKRRLQQQRLGASQLQLPGDGRRHDRARRTSRRRAASPAAASGASPVSVGSSRSSGRRARLGAARPTSRSSGCVGSLKTSPAEIPGRARPAIRQPAASAATPTGSRRPRPSARTTAD